jgi:phage terminase small subunit
MEKLTDKQRRFVDEYLIDLNAGQAAIRAGYAPSSARQHACRLLAREEVKRMVSEAMKRQQARTELTADEVIGDLRELRDICMGRKPLKVMTIVKNAREGTAEPVEVEGAMFEPAAANKALEMLGKHLQLFTEKMDVTSNGQTLQSGVLVVPEVRQEKDWENGSGT